MRSCRRPVALAALALALGPTLALGPSFGSLVSPEVAAAAHPPTARLAVTGQRSRVAIILFDTNVSPATGRVAAQRNAALAYARALPPAVEVGLITFGDTWRTALAPTADRAALARALAAVKPAGGTSNGLRLALVGAVVELGKLGAAQRSRLLVLSNGESLRVPVRAVLVPVDVITFSSDPDDFPRLIRQLAAATGGRIGFPADAADLAAAFPRLASPSPSPSPSATQTSHAALPGAAGPGPRGWRLSTSLESVLALVFVALLVLAVMALRSLRPGDRKPRLATQIGRYGPMTAAAVVAAAGQNAQGRIARAAVALMKQVLSSRSTEPRLARRLDQAGISRQPAEWALLGVCASVAFAAVWTVLLGNPFVGIVVGLGGGWAVMRVLLDAKIRRRRAAFDEQLPNVLQLIAGSIQSGFSLVQAMDAVVRENAQPASGEFARAIAENRLGGDLADALDAVAIRLESTDLRWVVMAVRIQRETGGNLAEVLRNTVATMRERGYLRRQVRTLSAEGRLSAYILLVLPVLIGSWLFYQDPAYMRPLYATFYGLVMLSSAAALIVIGAFWMRNVIKVEV